MFTWIKFNCPDEGNSLSNIFFTDFSFLITSLLLSVDSSMVVVVEAAEVSDCLVCDESSMDSPKIVFE